MIKRGENETKSDKNEVKKWQKWVTPIAMTAWWNQFQYQCEVLKLFVRSLRTLCPEPPNKLCEPSRQNIENTTHDPKTACLRPWSRLLCLMKQAPSDLKAGYMRPWNRLHCIPKQAPSGSQAGSVGVSSRLRRGLKHAPSGSQTGCITTLIDAEPCDLQDSQRIMYSKDSGI